jgi:N-carbamoylputrescine amidase
VVVARILKAGLIQCATPKTEGDLGDIRDAMMKHHEPFLEEAGKKGVQILCLQEIFNGPYFCPGQDPRWYDAAEDVPGPTTEAIAKLAAKHKMVSVIPVYERESAGVYYNTAAVYDADGTYSASTARTHPARRGLGEVLLQARQPRLPVFETRYARVGVYICYDRHFPEGARALGLNGAEIVFNPSATVAGLSQYLWKLEQPAHAVANGYFMGCINRVGTEAPWNIGKFYGTSYFVDPRGRFLSEATQGPTTRRRRRDGPRHDRGRSARVAVLRDRRPETYESLVALCPSAAHAFGREAPRRRDRGRYAILQGIGCGEALAAQSTPRLRAHGRPGAGGAASVPQPPGLPRHADARLAPDRARDPLARG